MTLPVNFDADSAARIYRAVREVERGNRDQKPLTFRTVAESPRRATFRISTFTGAWSKNSSKIVTFKYVTSTPNTALAINLFAAIGTAVSSRNCAISRDGTAWYLIAAECD